MICPRRSVRYSGQHRLRNDSLSQTRWVVDLNRYRDDLSNGLLEADYIVVEMARKILGEDWMPDYVARANAGGIERVLV